MEVEVGGRVAYKMLVVGGVVAAVPCPRAFAIFAVDVASLVCSLVFAHDEDARLQDFLAVGCGLTHKGINDRLMVLTQHRRHRIPLGGKIKQCKNIRAEESANFIYKLIPLQYGELKLPSIKIWEMSLNTNSKEKKLCSHYYLPQKIKII